MAKHGRGPGAQNQGRMRPAQEKKRATKSRASPFIVVTFEFVLSLPVWISFSFFFRATFIRPDEVARWW